MSSLPPVGVSSSEANACRSVERSIASQGADFYFPLAAASSSVFCAESLHHRKFSNQPFHSQCVATELTSLGVKFEQPGIFSWGILFLVLIVYGCLLLIPFDKDSLREDTQSSCAFITPLFADDCIPVLGCLLNQELNCILKYVVVSKLLLSSFGALKDSTGPGFTSPITPFFLVKCALLRRNPRDISSDGSRDELHKSKNTCSNKTTQTIHHPLQWLATKISLFLKFLSHLIDTDKNCLGRIVVASSDSIKIYLGCSSYTHLAVVDFYHWIYDSHRMSNPRSIRANRLWMWEMRKNLALAKPKVLKFNFGFQSVVTR